MSSIEINVTGSLLISENVTPRTDKKPNALNSPRDKGSEGATSKRLQKALFGLN